MLWKGIVVRLTPNETIILDALVNAGDWVTTDEFLEALYGAGEQAEAPVVKVHISNIRGKLKDAQIPIKISSDGPGRGRGNMYRLEY